MKSQTEGKKEDVKKDDPVESERFIEIAQQLADNSGSEFNKTLDVILDKSKVTKKETDKQPR